MSKTYSKDDLLTVKIEKLVPRGFGLSFADGLTIFTSLATVGDVVSVRLTEVKGKTAFAEVEQVLEPSPDRIVPQCKYFGSCGGCDFQQLSYAAQLEAKVAMIRDCIERIGKIELQVPINIIGSPEPFGYRLRAQWHVDVLNKKIGYYRRNTRELIEIENCPVLTPELNETLSEIRENIEWRSFFENKLQIDAARGSDGSVSIYSQEIVEPTNEIEVKAAGDRYLFNARSFFQGNRYLVDKLIELAVGDASGETALDLYCGVGLFSLPLARRFKNVIAVEESETANEFANRNAELAGLGNISFRVDGVRQFLRAGNVEKADFVLLDPPRAGTEKETIESVIALKPNHISYVACEPSVLARDLKRFVENGYKIDSVTALDLFPQTHHVETIAHLTIDQA